MNPSSKITIIHLHRIFLWCTLVFMLLRNSSTLGVYAQASDDECTEFDKLCEQIGDTISSNKQCVNRETIYMLASVQQPWSTARFYCQSVFGGHQSADLLYLPEQIDVVQFENFLHGLPDYLVNGEDFLTSGFCCIRSIEGTQTNEACVWMQNVQEVIPSDFLQLSKVDNNIESAECKFLTIIRQNNGTLKFDKKISSSSIQEYRFVCTYKRPDGCSPIYPLTSTTITTPTPTWTTPTPSPTSNITPSPITEFTPADNSTSSHNITDDQCIASPGSYGISYWPPVKKNETSVAECSDTNANYTGEAKWYCKPDGHFSENGPENRCVPVWMIPMYKSVKESVNIDQLVKVVTNLDEQMAKSSLMFPGALHQMESIIQEINNKMITFENQSMVEQITTITELVVNSCSNMVNDTDAWNQGSKSDSVNMAASMLHYVKNTGMVYSCKQAQNNSQWHTKLLDDKPYRNIYMNAFNLDHHQPINFTFKGNEFKLTNDDQQAYIGDKIDDDETLPEYCNHKIGLGILFDKLSTYLSASINDSDLVINSEVIAFNYNNITKTYRLPDQMTAQMALDFGAKPNCVFWNFTKNTWDSNDCWMVKDLSTRYKTVCECNHLTNFAVLMDVSGREDDSPAKTVLTNICTIASLVCLCVTLFFYMICRELRNRRGIILINLSISLIGVDLLVIFGLDAVEHEGVCKTVSILLLYFTLATFFWMLMEGYQLYQMVILVFNNIGHLRMLYMYCIGYGVPAVVCLIAGLVIGLRGELTNEYFCWISSSKFPYQVMALVVPATLIILINTVIMIMVLRTVFKMKFGKNNNSASIKPSHTGGGGNHSYGTYNNAFKNSITTTTNIPLNQRQRNLSVSNNSNVKKRFDTGNPFIGKKHKNQTDSSALSAEDSMTLEEQISQWMSYLKGYFSLMVLMGITWITYVLYIHECGHFFSYVFIVLNGSQGVFIFITQFIFDSKTLNTVRKRLYHMFGATLPFKSSTGSSKNATGSSAYSNSSGANNRVNTSTTSNTAVPSSSLSSSSQSSLTSSNVSSNSQIGILSGERFASKPRTYSLDYF